MDQHNNIRSLLDEAWTKRRHSQYEEARELVSKAHNLCDQSDFELLGRVYHIYMQFESDHDRIDEAMEMSHKSIKNYKADGKVDRIAHSVRHLADLYRRAGDFENGQQYYTEALDIYRGNPSTGTMDLANALRGYALLMEAMDFTEEAITAWQEAVDLYDDEGIQAGVEEGREHLHSLKEGL